MATFGRRLIVTTWATLAALTLVVALSAAQVCLDREHTHGGAVAPDCPMHHQARDKEGVAQNVFHHDHTKTTDVGNRSGQQIGCRCSNDITEAYLGQVAILKAPRVGSPQIQAVLMDLPSDVPAVDNLFPPPSPPPR
jgi:hypothetical protein